MIYVFILGISIFVIGFILKSALFKGWFGELLVNLANSLCLDKKTYHTLKNITLSTKDGTTQIDHIIISQYGIFVVETKNIKGWIFGKENEDTWTKQLSRNNKYPMQNPLRQNYKHIKTLSELVGMPESKFHSLIAFTGDSTFKTKMPANVTDGAPAYLAYIKGRKEIILSEKEVMFAVEKIQAYRLAPSMATSQQHIKHVQDIKNQKVAATKK
jgi:restriction system protein